MWYTYGDLQTAHIPPCSIHLATPAQHGSEPWWSFLVHQGEEFEVNIWQDRTGEYLSFVSESNSPSYSSNPFIESISYLYLLVHRITCPHQSPRHVFERYFDGFLKCSLEGHKGQWLGSKGIENRFKWQKISAWTMCIQEIGQWGLGINPI